MSVTLTFFNIRVHSSSIEDDMRGMPVRLTKMRRLLGDALRSSKGVPFAPVQRAMSLAPLVQARNRHPDKPPWSAVFVKGFALVAKEVVQLRQTYLAFPWARLHQYDYSVAIVAIERFNEGECWRVQIGPASRESAHALRGIYLKPD